jgi:glycosyltransferase involved in cell wall biosynthesis
MADIGLCMIIKNEAAIIERCLDSVSPLVDYYLIVDTGSTDDTVHVVSNWLRKNHKSGNVVTDTWKNFAHNRSSALEKLRNGVDVDYALMIDADEVLQYESDFDPEAFKKSLTEDCYNVLTKYGCLEYYRPQLTNNRKLFVYKAVLHEYLECLSPDSTRGTAVGFWNSPVQDGARSQDPEKFKKDAELLETALETEEDPFLRSRYTFYLAQCYRDYGDRDKAYEKYIERAGMGFWHEEVYISLLNAARIAEGKHELAAARFHNEQAVQTIPGRGEAKHNLARIGRKIASIFDAQHPVAKSAWEYASAVAEDIIANGRPEAPLFDETWIYEFGALDEYSIANYWLGNFTKSAEASRKMLECSTMPEDYRARVEMNLKFAEEKC